MHPVWGETLSVRVCRALTEWFHTAGVDAYGCEECANSAPSLERHTTTKNHRWAIEWGYCIHKEGLSFEILSSKSPCISWLNASIGEHDPCQLWFREPTIVLTNRAYVSCRKVSGCSWRRWTRQVSLSEWLACQYSARRAHACANGVAVPHFGCGALKGTEEDAGAFRSNRQQELPGHALKGPPQPEAVGFRVVIGGSSARWREYVQYGRWLLEPSERGAKPRRASESVVVKGHWACVIFVVQLIAGKRRYGSSQAGF